MQTIHFKVAANNSFRRFSLANPTLGSLKTQVASLFGIDSLEGWTIKYKDEESQLVSIASDEELSYAAQFIAGKVLNLIISFPGGERERVWNKHHHKGRPENKERLAARLQKKQRRIRDRLASLESSDHPRAKAQVSRLEDEISAISMELESLNIQDDKKGSSSNSSVELVTAPLSVPKHTERKPVRCNKISCLQRKQERVGEKLLKLSADPENPRKQAKVSKLTEKLAAISAKLEVMEKESSNSSSSSSSGPSVKSELKEDNTKQQSEPVSEISADKQLVEEVKSKFFSLRRELHQERMNIISLGKVLGALRVISRHGTVAGIHALVNDEQVAQTEISLGLAKDEFAAKKLVIQQQKELLCNLRQQLGFSKNWKDRKDRKDKKDWKHKEEREKRVKKGRVEKSDRTKSEKKFRKEKRERHGKRGCEGGQGRRFCKGVRPEREEISESSSDSEKLEF